MLYNRRIDKMLILILPAALFVYASTQPHMRLQTGMPVEFVDVQPHAGSAQRVAEERLAQAYWECVLTNIQWKYTYGSMLPNSPPPDFRPVPGTLPGTISPDTSQVRYWNRLRRVWGQPSSWTMKEEWSTDWITKPIYSCVQAFDAYINDLFHRS